MILLFHITWIPYKYCWLIRNLNSSYQMLINFWRFSISFFYLMMGVIRGKMLHQTLTNFWKMKRSNQPFNNHHPTKRRRNTLEELITRWELNWRFCWNTFLRNLTLDIQKHQVCKTRKLCKLSNEGTKHLRVFNLKLVWHVFPSQFLLSY